MHFRAALDTLVAVLSVFALDEVQSRQSVTEMCPWNKEVKIRRVQRLEMGFWFYAAQNIIKTFLSVFFSPLYSLMLFILVFM